MVTTPEKECIQFRGISYQYNHNFRNMQITTHKDTYKHTQDLTLKNLGTLYPLIYIDIARFCVVIYYHVMFKSRGF